MVRKIQAKLVLRLHAQGLSGRAIARSQGMSRRSVSDVMRRGRRRRRMMRRKTDGEVYALLFPGRGERESVYEQPDWARVHRELARVGVTLRILHGEYADGCRRTGKPHMGYDRFCKLYAAYVQKLGVTSRVEHKAGRTIEVDWAGKTLRIVDPVTDIRVAGRGDRLQTPASTRSPTVARNTVSTGAAPPTRGPPPVRRDVPWRTVCL